jgi:hypothetical protein
VGEVMREHFQAVVQIFSIPRDTRGDNTTAQA